MVNPTSHKGRKNSAAGVSGKELEYLAFGRLAEEVEAALAAGRGLDVEALAAKHPELADQIDKVLPALKALYELGQESSSQPPEGEPRSELGVLGGFRILREAGRGGMGVVYEAEELSLGRRVALKVLPFAAVLDQKQLRRFKNESQAAAGLHHQNIVPVYSVGCQRGVHYFAMQYIEGHTLAEVIRQLRTLERSDGEAFNQAGALRSSEAWNTIGPPFANHPYVMFELFNESGIVAKNRPRRNLALWMEGGAHTHGDGTRRTYIGHQTMLNSFRERDWRNFIVVNTMPWARRIDSRALAINDPLGRLAFTVHPYTKKAGTTRVEWDASFGDAAEDVIVLVNEWFSNSKAPFSVQTYDLPEISENFLSYLRDKHIPLWAFAFDIPATIVRDYMARRRCWSLAATSSGWSWPSSNRSAKRFRARPGSRRGRC